jgi:hypothetical protein
MAVLADGDLPGPLRELARHAKLALKADYVKPMKRVFDNAKVSDHFAIIPTLQTPTHLSEAEAKLYDLVVKRFIAVFYPPAEYLLTTRITTVGAHSFQTNGRVLVNAGWQAVYGKEAQDEDANLVPVLPDETVRTVEVNVLALKTKPPATSMAWALYVNDVLIPKYWEYAEGIYFNVIDPQFFVDHKGKRLRFSQNGTDFFDTGVKLAPAPSVADSNATGLPLQADVLK